MDANNLKILAIDDQPDNLTTIKALLTEALPGCTVLTALDGLSGIALAREIDPDTILLDIVMPDIDGFETCRRLKAEERVGDIPVVFLTALGTDRATRLEALEAGGEAFLPKPPDEQELLAQIRAMAKLKAASRMRRLERDELADLVLERTRELEQELAERRRVEEELRESHSKATFQAELLWNAPAVAAFHDTELNLIWANRAYELAFGRSVDEMVGHKCYTAWGLTKPCRGCPIVDAVASGRPCSAELTPQNQDHWPESHGHWLSQVAPVRDRDEHIIGVIEIATDITERKQMQAQLAQSDRLASMGMLAAGVAHEINNPLSYVLYNLESLSDELPRLIGALRPHIDILAGWLMAEDASAMVSDLEIIDSPILDDILECVTESLQGIQRIREVSRGLGTFSRIDDSRPVSVDIEHVIDVATNMVSNELKYRARLVKEYGDVSSVMASDGKLSQVFMNLLINAVHALDDGRADSHEILVRTWQEGEEVFAEVRDDGKGISEKDIPHIFEPFYTTKKVGVGTGLGLSISKNIVEGYGGCIEVKSEVGKGTSFVVRLPAEPQVRAADAPQVREPAAEAMARGRILVVDDEEGIRSAMARILKGNQVVQAASGGEAREILEADQDFDVILCDIMMPTVSGVDLHAWLATENPELAKQLVFITGGAFTPMTREYLTKVSNLRLEKPFHVVEFRKTVSELIRSAKQARGE